MLTNLPVELVEAVISSLHAIDVLNLSAVNRHLRSIIYDSIPAQYIIELHCTGNIDGNTEIPLHDRLRMLRAFDHRQRNAHRYKPRREICFENETQPGPFEYCFLDAGFFAHMYRIDGGWALIILDQLPSALVQEEKGREMTRKSFTVEEDVADFSLFVEWNLLAVRTNQNTLQLLSINDGEYHPCATSPVIPLPSTSSDASGIDIFNDLVGLLFSRHDTHQIIIWDWIGGRELVDHTITADFVNFTLLSEYSFVTISSTERPLAITLYHIHREAYAPQAYFRIASFELPMLAPLSFSDFTCYILLSARSAPTTTPSFYDDLNTGKTLRMPAETTHLPFRPRHGDPLLALELMTTVRETEARYSYTLFVDCRAFRTVIENHLAVNRMGPTAEANRRSIPWEDWGPTMTRLIEWQVDDTRSQGYMCGPRYTRAIIDPRSDEEEDHNGAARYLTTILDFNQEAVRHYILHNKPHFMGYRNPSLVHPLSENTTFRLVTGTHTTLPKGFWANPVQTSLSYVMQTINVSALDVWFDNEHGISIESFAANGFRAHLLEYVDDQDE